MGKEFWARRDQNGVSNEEKFLNYQFPVEFLDTEVRDGKRPPRVLIQLHDEKKIRKLKRFLFKYNRGLSENYVVIRDEEAEDSTKRRVHLSTFCDMIRKEDCMFSFPF